MSELGDLVRRQNEEKDQLHVGDGVVIGNGEATGVYVEMLLGKMKIRIVTSTKPEIYRIGESYDILTQFVRKA